MNANTKIWSRNRKQTGLTTGTSKPCPLADCRGVCLKVKWSDGKTTWPCTEGMYPYYSGARIR